MKYYQKGKKPDADVNPLAVLGVNPYLPSYLIPILALSVVYLKWSDSFSNRQTFHCTVVLDGDISFLTITLCVNSHAFASWIFQGLYYSTWLLLMSLTLFVVNCIICWQDKSAALNSGNFYYWSVFLLYLQTWTGLLIQVSAMKMHWDYTSVL